MPRGWTPVKAQSGFARAATAVPSLDSASLGVIPLMGFPGLGSGSLVQETPARTRCSTGRLIWRTESRSPKLCGDVRRGNDMTTDYEVTYIIRPSLEEADVDARVAALAESLKNGGGEVGEIEKMGKRRLAYEIDDVREGYYVVMKFKSDAAQAKELERQMRLNEDVMRALLIRLDQ